VDEIVGAHNLFYTVSFSDKGAHAFNEDICLQCCLSATYAYFDISKIATKDMNNTLVFYIVSHALIAYIQVHATSRFI